MNLSRIIVACSFITIVHLPGYTQQIQTDSLTLAQAFVNLSLTQQYFYQLPDQRIVKILPYEKNELKLITDDNFIKANNTLFNLSYALVHLNSTRLALKKNAFTRNELLSIKKEFDSTIAHFNSAGISSYLQMADDPSEDGDRIRSHNEYVGFSDTLCDKFKSNIRQLRTQISNLFNNDIYPDFQRIFYSVKQSEKLYFDSLKYYTDLFGLPLDSFILKNENMPVRRISMETRQGVYTLSPQYVTNQKLELVSEYLQLFYIAGKEYNKHIRMADRFTLHDNFDMFSKDLSYLLSSNMVDSFFVKEFTNEAIEKLRNKLNKKYPLTLDGHGNPRHMAMPSMVRGDDRPGKYYFPLPAPRPSAALYLSNYKPELSNYKQVDNYLSGIFNSGGYSNRLHYYYVKSGFAITTSLEKMNADGSPAPVDQRWKVSVTGNGSFSMYQVFKSIFFDMESNFRMFALIVAPTKATVQSSPSSLAAMSELITYSYPSLPADLNDIVPTSKTLSILVYHYKQSDIGEVPVMVVNNALPVAKHLNSSGLGALLNP